MNNIFSFYNKYTNHIDEYNQWTKQKQDADNNSTSYHHLAQLRDKAKAIAEPILLSDKYEHEKAEDAETFFQTYNIELMSLTAFLSSVPLTITKLIPFLNKNSRTKKAGELLTKYKNASFCNLSVPKLSAMTACVISGIMFVMGIKNSMQSQLGLIRKASFDASSDLINNPKLFAVFTQEQENQINSIVNYEGENNSGIVDKLKEKVNIHSSFQSVNDYKKNLSEYNKQKQNYFNENNPETVENKELMESYLKNVEHNVLEPLRKVETISNISYSALFTGGFLEYLITDKLVEVLGIKNKILSTVLKLGTPLLTYLILNKNISNIENKAILATKYKHLKKFTENPLQCSNEDTGTNKNPFKFLKTVYKDMKEYEKFETNELPKLKERAEAKKQIQLTPKQEADAIQLKKDTIFTLNNQREKLYEQSVGIKAFSETILGPLDIIATAIGGKIGHSFSKKCSNKKISGLLTGLGAILAFIPAAITEAKLTKQQKLSEKIAVMLSVKDLQKTSKSSEYKNFPKEFSQTFKDFILTE